MSFSLHEALIPNYSNYCSFCLLRNTRSRLVRYRLETFNGKSWIRQGGEFSSCSNSKCPYYNENINREFALSVDEQKRRFVRL